MILSRSPLAAVIGSVIAFLVGCTSTPTRSPDSVAEANFLVGYNEAWFGPNYSRDLTTSFQLETVRRTFADLKAAGGDIVRLWVFEGREGLILQNTKPQITGVQSALLTNLDLVLTEARGQGLRVAFALIDGNEMPSEQGLDRDFYFNLMNDKDGEGDAFREKALVPLLEVLNRHRETVFALDLMNEIQAPISRAYWTDHWTGPRQWMRTHAQFLKARAPWLKLTTSSGWKTASHDIAKGLFSGLGLDFYDLHVYSDEGQIGLARAVCARSKDDGVPVWLGEFGQLSKEQDDGLQAHVTKNFLQEARAQCFFGALAWRFDADEAWWNFQRADGGLRPAAKFMKLR